jgi:four helix bundle protein
MYKSFKDMTLWREAMDVAVEIFSLTENLPRKEDYGFTSQVRRAALSISGNVAEAYGRNHTSDKINFYYMARGSITELQSHLEYGRRVGYLDGLMSNEIDDRLAKLHSDLNKVIVTLRNNTSLKRKVGNKNEMVP